MANLQVHASNLLVQEGLRTIGLGTLTIFNYRGSRCDAGVDAVPFRSDLRERTVCGRGRIWRFTLEHRGTGLACSKMDVLRHQQLASDGEKRSSTRSFSALATRKLPALICPCSTIHQYQRETVRQQAGASDAQIVG